MSVSPWTLTGHRAALAVGALTVRFDADQPRLGLSEIHYAGRSLHQSALFQFGSETSDKSLAGASEVYVRGDDLIATYERTATRPLRVQALWHALPASHSAPAVGIELVVSVQTDLLDSDPELTITSALAANGIRRLIDAGQARFETRSPDLLSGSADDSSRIGCCLFDLSPETSYLEQVHPSDFRGVVISTTREAGAMGATAPTMYRLQTRLFSERLEKGVILRSRLRGYFLPYERSEAVAAQLYQEFSASEPPLTA